MARISGQKYVHITYEAEDKKPHDLYSGNECWCEPKCARLGDHILVIHDPQDGILVIEDTNPPVKRGA